MLFLTWLLLKTIVIRYRKRNPIFMQSLVQKDIKSQWTSIVVNNFYLFMVPHCNQQPKALSHCTFHLHFHIELFIYPTSKLKEHMLDWHNWAITADCNRMEETSRQPHGPSNAWSGALKTLGTQSHRAPWRRIQHWSYVSFRPCKHVVGLPCK